MAEEDQAQLVNYASLQYLKLQGIENAQEVMNSISRQQLSVVNSIKTLIEGMHTLFDGITDAILSAATYLADTIFAGFTGGEWPETVDILREFSDLFVSYSEKFKSITIAGGHATKTSTGKTGLEISDMKGLAQFVGSMKMFKSILTQIGTMIPGMVQFALVTAPAQAAISGFLEIFEPFTEIFGAFGESLSLAFAPLVQMISEQLVQFIPIIINVANGIAPLITLFGRLANVGINALMKAFVAFEPILEPIADILNLALTPLVKLVDWVATLTPLWDTLASVLEVVGGWLEKVVDWFRALGERIQEFMEDVDVFGVFD